MDGKAKRATDATLDFFSKPSVQSCCRVASQQSHNSVFLADCKTPLFFSLEELFNFVAECRATLISGRFLLPSAHIVRCVGDMIVQMSSFRNR